MLATLTMDIGNATDAHTAYMQTIGPTTPKGWRYLGSGSYRDVYLSPTGVVYKVNSCSDDDYGSNDSEWDNYLRIRVMQLPDWLSVPAMSLYGNVMAAEYIDSPKLNVCSFSTCLCGGIWDGRCQVHLHDEVNDLLDLSDMHNENLIPVRTLMGYVWYAIDLGQ